MMTPDPGKPHPDAPPNMTPADFYIARATPEQQASRQRSAARVQ
jgi:hypothetical protein